MRFPYDDSYHTSLSVALYKVLCDDLVGCLYVRQDQISMSLRGSDHGEYNRKVSITGERLVTGKDYLMIV